MKSKAMLTTSIYIYNNKLINMKSKAMLTTSIIMTVLMIGLIIVPSPLVTMTYATGYNGYKSYGEYMPYNNYKDYYNKVKIFPPSGTLTAAWVQWVIDIPKEINPLLDETGENCDINQQGPVWFLATVTLPLTEAERECTIPEGKKILVPITGKICAELSSEDEIREALGIPEGQPIPEAQLEEGLRLCAENVVDQTEFLKFSIDGKKITNFEDFRVQSPLFTVSFPEDNVFDEMEFIDILQKSVSDGYWVLVKGLEPGEHTIEFRVDNPAILDVEAHVTYHITIEPANNNNNNDNNYYDNNYGSYNNNDNNYHYY